MTIFRKKNVLTFCRTKGLGCVRPFDPTPVCVKGEIFACVVFYASFPLMINLICNSIFRKEKHFDPIPGVEFVCKGKIVSSLLLYASFLKKNTLPYSENVDFRHQPNPIGPPRELDPGLQTEILFDTFHLLFLCLQAKLFV